MKRNKLNKWSFGLLICYFDQNELASIFTCYILIITIISKLPLTSSLSRTSTLLSFSFLQSTLSSLTILLPIVSTNEFTPKIISNEKLNNLESLNIQSNRTKSTVLKSTEKFDYNLFVSKPSIFPCLDNLELNILNLSQPLNDYHHLIRVYHSNELNNKNKEQTNASNHSESFNLSELQFTYVKEFILNSSAINAKCLIYCNLFDPVYKIYSFRYVSIHKENGQIGFESDLYCLPTLEKKQQNLVHQNHQNTKLNKLNKFNYSTINSRYGSSLKLFSEEDNEKKLFYLNKKFNRSIQQEQIKHSLVCSCGKRTFLESNRTSYLIQLTSGNGYCNGNNQVNYQSEKVTSKTLIKIKKLNFEFCFIDLSLPSYIQIKVKDILSFDKKDQDLKQFSFALNNLIIRDGQTYISPQLNYFHSFPAFHFISSGLLRFEFRTLGNQYLIELNKLNDQIDLSESYLVDNNLEEESNELNEQFMESSENKTKSLFLNERKIKMNHTEQILKNLMNQNEFKMKRNQILALKHVDHHRREANLYNSDNFKNLKDENLFVLLVDRNGQNLLIDNQFNLSQTIRSFLKELTLSNQQLDEQLNAKIMNQLKAKTLILNLIALIIFSLISVSISIFLLILTKTKIRPPTGNLIRFGLSSETLSLDLLNNYQEVQSNSSNKLRTKLVRIDEEAIYESCKTKSLSDQDSNDEDDLLNNTDSENDELNNELNDLSKDALSSGELSNAETLKNETNLYKSSFKDDFHELNKKRKMFKNCLNNCSSKDDVSNSAVGRLSQCSFPTSEISLELDYYDYITPFVPKIPMNNLNLN